jgi:uncharacterized protein YdeI (BOF family)
MKRSKSPILFSVLALAAVLFALHSDVAALQEPANPPTQQPQTQGQEDPAAQSSTMSQGAETQVFSGKIARASGKYVLKDNATKMTYMLDDQTQAKKFEGQSVKVTGMLDAQSNTIHVSLIEPGS